MAYSMTGFGRAERTFDTRSYSVEIKSVNSRYCDISLRMPRIFNFADSSLRKLLNDKLTRGKVDAYISFSDISDASSEVTVDEGLAKAYSEAVSNIAGITGRPDEVTASRLALFPDVVLVKQGKIDEDRIYAELLQTFEEAVDGMLQMRLTEGNNLSNDLIGKLDSLEAVRLEVEERSPLVVEEYREKLSSRLDELLDDKQRAFYDEGRLTAEVAVFADKCAIDEEVTRLKSHFEQGRKILLSEGPVGKRMDFLVQEINREVNTIGSKANDLEITNRVMLMKNIVEKMREQIQNLV